MTLSREDLVQLMVFALCEILSSFFQVEVCCTLKLTVKRVAFAAGFIIEKEGIERVESVVSAVYVGKYGRESVNNEYSWNDREILKDCLAKYFVQELAFV